MTGPRAEGSAEGSLEFADAAAGLRVPPALRASVARHRAHLTHLATALRAAGMQDTQIQANIDMLVASYRSELIHVLQSSQRVDPDA